ncbi:MAG: septation ring formation regulator EzrA [Bacilli bacterium]|nr:septation ring formation regulator EzrA [Bacilli bacterium]
MKGTLLYITVYIVVISILVGIFLLKNARRKKKLKEQIANLEKEKNLIISAPILSELGKVESLVKDDKLKVKYTEWQDKFEDIRKNELPKISDMILDADGLLEKKNYKELRSKLVEIELDIYRLKERTNGILSEIQGLTLSEEKNRERIVELKSKYREIKAEYEKNKETYGSVTNQIDLEFESIEKRFSEFEIAMDEKDYDEINYIVKGIDEMIEHADYVVKEIPAIIIMCNELIPNKISDISNLYIEMTRNMYQLDYLNVEYNIEETNKKLKDITDRVKVLNLEDVVFELKTILNYFDSLYTDFENEKMSKKKFDSNMKSFKTKLTKTDKVVKNIKSQINELKTNYELSNENIERIEIIDKEVTNIKNSYNELTDYSKNHTFPYTKLIKELDLLIIKLSKIDENLDYDVHTIGSMKDDEARAREQLDNIKKLIKKTKNRIRCYNIPVIPNNYYVELNDANDAIKEINKELNRKPITIEVLNIRVDTARDLAFKVYNTVNGLIKSVMMAEETMVYGNRYRGIKQTVDQGLDKAESLFMEGEYKKSLELTLNSIEYIEPGIHNKLLKVFDEKE